MESYPGHHPATYTEVYFPTPQIIGRALVHPQPYEVTRGRYSLPPPPPLYYGPREQREQYAPNVPESFYQLTHAANRHPVPIYRAHGSTYSNAVNNRYLEQYPGNIPGLPPGHVRFSSPSRYQQQQHDGSFSLNGFGGIVAPQANGIGVEQVYAVASQAIPSEPNGEQALEGENEKRMNYDSERRNANNWDMLHGGNFSNRHQALGSVTTGETPATQDSDKTHPNLHSETPQLLREVGWERAKEATPMSSQPYDEEAFAFLEGGIKYPGSSSASATPQNPMAPPPLHQIMTHHQQHEYGALNHYYSGRFQPYQPQQQMLLEQESSSGMDERYNQQMIGESVNSRKLRNERRRAMRRPRCAPRGSETVPYVYPPHGPRRGRGCSNQWSGGVVEVGNNLPELPSSSSGTKTAPSGENQGIAAPARDVGEGETEAPSQSENNSNLEQLETKAVITATQRSTVPMLAKLLDAPCLNRASGADKFNSKLFAALTNGAQQNEDGIESDSNAAARDDAPDRSGNGRGKVQFEVEEIDITSDNDEEARSEKND